MRMKTAAGLGGSAAVDEIDAAFVRRYLLESWGVADEYAIHGGGYLVRVRGIMEGAVAVVVSGLMMTRAHEVAAETLRRLLPLVKSELKRGWH